MERFARASSSPMSSPLKRAFSEPAVTGTGSSSADLLERAAKGIDQPEDGINVITPGATTPTVLKQGVSVPLSDADYQAIRNQYLKSTSKYPAFTSRELEAELNAYDEYVKNQEENAERDGVPPSVCPYSACGRRYPSNHMNPLLKPYNPDFVSEDSSSSSSLSHSSQDIHVTLATGVEVDGVIRFDKPLTKSISLPVPAPSPQERVPIQRALPPPLTESASQVSTSSAELAPVLVPIAAEVSAHEGGSNEVVARKSSPSTVVNFPVAPVEITSNSQLVADAICEARENCTELMRLCGLETHTFPRVTDKALNEISTVQTAQAARVSLRLLVPEIVSASGSRNDEVLRSLDVVDSLMLVLVSRIKGSGQSWSIPVNQDFHDVLNAVDCQIFEDKIDACGLISSAIVWEGVGKFGLRAADPGKVDRWRRCLAELDFGSFEWNSFPVDALVAGKKQVSILLKNDLRNFKLKWLTHGLLLANRQIQGRVEAKYTKNYTDSSVTKFGISKKGWRVLSADVDSAF